MAVSGNRRSVKINLMEKKYVPVTYRFERLPRQDGSSISGEPL